MRKTGQVGDPADFVIITTAGEALSARDACYIDATDGKAYKTDSDDLTKMDFAGIAQEAAALNAAVSLIPRGTLVPGFSGLTKGARYYVSGTSGAITATAPTNLQQVGVAVSTTVLLLDNYPTFRIVPFAASGTYTKRPGLKYARVYVQGAGGNGATDGAGGASGAWAMKILLPGAIGATETVTIGAAGVGSGSTSFGSLVTCGNGGNASGATPGTGGTATGGDININGQSGQGNMIGNGMGGDGGSSPLGRGGFGGKSASVTNVSNGQAGNGYGAGGGGGAAASDGSPSGGTGGAGVIGFIYVEEHY